MRKNVLKYDDVLNKQRMVIYAQRRQVLEGEDLSRRCAAWIDEVVERVVDQYTPRARTGGMDLDALVQAMQDAVRRPRSRSTSCARRSASTARR